MAGPVSSPRPFGLVAEDLEIDFSTPDRPALVTALLAACAGPRGAAHWWAQPVGTRHRALLALLCAGDGDSAIEATARCPSCGERSAFVLPLAQVLQMPVSPDGVIAVDAGGRALRLRRATGEDLRAWRASPPRSRGQMLRSLLHEGELQPGDDERASRALADADPLVAFAVQCVCPDCGAQAGHEVDLEALALQRLAARQRAIVGEVHRLASRYGWTEAQVLAVAPARRARYLALIEAEA